MKNKFYKLYLLIIFALIFNNYFVQAQTMGLFINDTVSAYKGYTLFAPKQYTATYLINNQGRLINKWTNSIYPPGQSVYLLPNGHLLRSCMVQGQLGTGGGEGGRIEEYTWGDTLVWYFNYYSSTYTSHHDIKRLPNGNIIMLAVEKKTLVQLLAAGFNPSKYQPEITTKGYMLPDYVIEIQPTYPSGGTIVWEWHVWDHLIQDYDSTKSNYGVVANHPELIDADGDGRQLPCFWNHMNSISYNAKFDQIMLSVRGNSEVWIIDHSTTTQQSAGHSGGRYGKGGDLLYRWGNPKCYGLGNASNQKLFEQHDAVWIDSSYPGAGNILVFNNGVGRNFSSVDQFAPPVDANGFYQRTSGTIFGPSAANWTYTATPTTSFYAPDICGAQRLPNGNTLICHGTLGIFFEVNPAGQTVWKYINPVTNNGPLYQGDSIPHDPTHPFETMNSEFRIEKYSPAYEGLMGRNLTAGSFIELYHVGINEEGLNTVNSFSLKQNYPNPFNPTTTINYSLPIESYVSIKIFDTMGKEVKEIVNELQNEGNYSVNFNGAELSSGIYFYKIVAFNSKNNFISAKKMILLK